MSLKPNTYDELPYDSLPLPETHPSYVAALAWLHGFEAADPRRARVLELGCASGGNLLPYAWYMPEATCLGLELSQKQAEAGQALVAAAGMTNVQILHEDLTRSAKVEGEYDYIIAHGLYSWVEPPVQAALLRLCAEHLSPNGIVYVSYNVLPGWHSRQALREHLMRHVARIRAPAHQVEAARRELDQLAADWWADSPLSQYADLPAEISYLRRAGAGYLFHEYLGDINEPLTVGDFLARVQMAGLDYLCDAGPGLCGRQVSLRSALAEQQYDQRVLTRFRRSLLTRQRVARRHNDPEFAIEGLAFHSALRCDEEIDLDSAAPQAFMDSRGTTHTIRHPLCKAAFIVLAAVYPESITRPDLVEAARGLLQQFGAIAMLEDEAGFRREWLQLVFQHAVMPCHDAQTYFNDLSLAPRAHALARAQAASGMAAVAGAHHVALELDAGGRDLLALLDGTNTRIALTAKLLSRCEARGQFLGVEEITQNCDRLLQLFARSGLLVA